MNNINVREFTFKDTFDYLKNVFIKPCLDLSLI